MAKIKCCYKCLKRTSTCHISCNEYKTEKELVDRENSLIREHQDRALDYLSVKFQGKKNR